MTVSTSLDPVETIVDVLEYATEAPIGYGTSYGGLYGSSQQWAHADGPPDHIERYEETDFSRKKSRDMKDAVYVRKSESGSFDKLGAAYDGMIDDHTIRIEVWTPESESKAHAYALDIRSILKNYADDNQQSTAWTQIAPVGDDDERASARASGADHYVMAVLAQLIAARD